MSLLEIRDLHTYFDTRRGLIKAVNGVSLHIDEGETLGVVGESGSGKSQTALSILQLFEENQRIYSGQIIFAGRDITHLPTEELYEIRGNSISMIFQEPMTSLNPVFTVSRQISESLILHQGLSKQEAHERSVEMLRSVQIANPEQIALQYPHQLSGGMRQRVMIAIALACRPQLLIADEPTTALDVTIQAQILRLMNDLKHEFNTAIMFITHDLGLSTRWPTMWLCVLRASGRNGPGGLYFQATQPFFILIPRHFCCPFLCLKGRQGRRLEAIPGAVPHP